MLDLNLLIPLKAAGLTVAQSMFTDWILSVGCRQMNVSGSESSL